MSKSELRKAYEAVFGVVDGVLKLYDDKGNVTYYEASDGSWVKYEYDVDGNKIYYESSNGVIYDKRPCADKVFIDEQSGKKFKLTEVK